MAASKQASIHTHVRNAVMLVWGSLRLAPINHNMHIGFAQWQHFSAIYDCLMIHFIVCVHLLIHTV